MEGATKITGWVISDGEDVQSIQADLQIQYDPKCSPICFFVFNGY